MRSFKNSPFGARAILGGLSGVIAGALALVRHRWRTPAALGAKFNRLPILSPAKEPFSWESLAPAVEHDITLAKAPL